MSSSGRKHERYSVPVKVSFSSATDFVTQYAENLSAGGVFIPGRTDLEHLQELDVEIELPGFQTAVVRARVAHVLTPEQAGKFGRPSGTGMEILKMPPGFENALMQFLSLLGQRRDHLVMVADEIVREFIEASGYKVASINGADPVSEFSAAGATVLAVIVSRFVRPEFAEALHGVLSDAEQLIGVPEGVDLAAVVAELDRRL